MREKEIFIEDLKKRTKKLAIDIIELCNTLKPGTAANVIAYQIIKSSSSTGANYRAACRARSKAEFFSKICIVVEESDETVYWLEIINDAKLTKKKEELQRLLQEAEEVTKIMSKARSSSYDKNK